MRIGLPSRARACGAGGVARMDNDRKCRRTGDGLESDDDHDARRPCDEKRGDRLRENRAAQADGHGATGTRASYAEYGLSLIHISEPTRQAEISYAVFCL